MFQKVAVFYSIARSFYQFITQDLMQIYCLIDSKNKHFELKYDFALKIYRWLILGDRIPNWFQSVNNMPPFYRNYESAITVNSAPAIINDEVHCRVQLLWSLHYVKLLKCHKRVDIYIYGHFGKTIDIVAYKERIYSLSNNYIILY